MNDSKKNDETVNSIQPRMFLEFSIGLPEGVMVETEEERKFVKDVSNAVNAAMIVHFQENPGVTMDYNCSVRMRRAVPVLIDG
jgi:hypothetical protein